MNYYIHQGKSTFNIKLFAKVIKSVNDNIYLVNIFYEGIDQKFYFLEVLNVQFDDIPSFKLINITNYHQIDDRGLLFRIS